MVLAGQKGLAELMPRFTNQEIPGSQWSGLIPAPTCTSPSDRCLDRTGSLLGLLLHSKHSSRESQDSATYVSRSTDEWSDNDSSMLCTLRVSIALRIWCNSDRILPSSQPLNRLLAQVPVERLCLIALPSETEKCML